MHQRSRRGFTLIEMLTVIGIIVILLAILMPVVGKVRKSARVAATQLSLNQLAGAIDQYYLEFNHTYPGPVTNTGISNNSSGITGLTGGSLTMTENMVLGLCGGLQISTSGSISYVSTDLQSGLGPLNLTTIQSKQTRHIAFIDASPGQRMLDLPWDGGNGKCGTSDTNIPEFQDKFIAAPGPSMQGGFPRPILYLRARTGNPANAGSTGTPQICNTDDKTAQYNWKHLVPYAGATDFYGFGAGAGVGTTDLTQGGTNSEFAPFITSKSVNGTSMSTLWDAYLCNPNLPQAPRGVNAYILISAGPDGLFGTQDDIFYP